MNFKKLALAAAVVSVFACGSAIAATATGNMDVSATLTSACEVSASSIGLGSRAALASSEAMAAGSSSLTVACSASATAPSIWSDSTRVMTNDGGVGAAGNTIAFNLSLANDGLNTLPTTTGAATALGITQDGTAQAVTVYAAVPVANFQGKTSGSYAKAVTLSVNY